MNGMARSQPSWSGQRPGGILCAAMLVASLVTAGPSATPAEAHHLAFTPGDVFVGTDQGKIKRFTPAGALVETLQTGMSSTVTGMCFDGIGNLYATDFDFGTLSLFDNSGALVAGTWGLPFGSGSGPESCVVDAAGDVYVGQADGNRDVLKFSPTGAPLQSYNVAIEDRGSDFIDMAADQKTLYYTSEDIHIKRYNVSTIFQQSDFATSPFRCYALRIRANGEVIAACGPVVIRFSATGTILNQYGISGISTNFALDLDPDGTTFWAGDFGNGKVARVDISTGAIVSQFNAGSPVRGLRVYPGVTSSKATPTITTQAHGGGTVGNVIHDTAFVTGGVNPTGQVTYWLWSDPACTKLVHTAANSLQNGSTTSGIFIPTVAGTYYWTAMYGGNANNNVATSPCGAPNESVTIDKAQPTISTEASFGPPVGTGDITDTAYVNGGVNPTGTVTFRLYSDANCTTQVFTSTTYLSVDPFSGMLTATSDFFQAPAAGTYYWVAVYDGDDNNEMAVSPCGAPNESVTVTRTSPQLTTQASPGTLGGPIDDTATLIFGFNPTGNVAFALYGPNIATCSGLPVFTSTTSLMGVSATSGSFTPTTPGTYRWTAVYNGDGNNAPATSPCNAANESVTIKAAPILTTTASSGTLGGAVSDTATLTGGSNPTGTVTFHLYSDPTCSTQVFTSTNNLAGGSATSGSYTPTVAGTYYWTAVYNGDNNNATATSPCGAADESVTITRAAPTLKTTASAGTFLGGAVFDTATLTGGFNPTGSVTFRLYSNPTCSTQVFTSTTNLAGGSATSGSYTPTVAGTYYWTAVYNGNVNNLPATSPCGAANESVAVKKAIPTLSTTASASTTIGTPVSDTATLSGGFNPTGTITFRLYGPNNFLCSGVGVFTPVVNVAGNGVYPSGSYVPIAVGSYRWTAVYSGDTKNAAVTSPCNAANESVTITRAAPTLKTTASAGTFLGGAVFDTATLTGGFNPTGSVTFRLYSNPTCSTQVFTSTTNLAGGSATSGSYTPTVAGTYYWTAVYNGNVNNLPATSPCGAAKESVAVKPFLPPNCTRQIGPGQVVRGPISVKSGETVCLRGAVVVGDVTVSPGGAVTITDTRLVGNVVANGPAFFSLCRSQIAGAVSVSNSTLPFKIGDPEAGCSGNSIAQSVNVTGNTGGLSVGVNSIGANLIANSNKIGASIIKANKIGGSLACTGNSPLPINSQPPSNTPQTNSAATKTGDCAAL